MSRILLDTNAYSRLLRGHERVSDHLSSGTEIIMSVVVIAELLTGFKGGSRERDNTQVLDRFLKRKEVRVAPVQRSTSEIFAEIKNRLKAKGRPIPINDVWIAAHNIENGSVLVTFDRHFEAVDGLRLWKGWE